MTYILLVLFFGPANTFVHSVEFSSKQACERAAAIVREGAPLTIPFLKGLTSVVACTPKGDEK